MIFKTLTSEDTFRGRLIFVLNPRTVLGSEDSWSRYCSRYNGVSRGQKALGSQT